MDRRRRSNGYILMVVLITMTVIIVTLVAMVRQASIVANAIRTHKEQSQVHWILESGIERAKARRISDPEFASETWLADLSLKGNQPAAVVETTIQDDAKLGTAIIVTVTIAKKSRPDLTVRRTIPFTQPVTTKE